MKFIGKLKMKSRNKIIEFLNTEHVGRIATIDKNGFPQVIPMNFVFANNFIYMHSHVNGEKLDNIESNSKTGFEVDKELEYLPSYFEDDKDASFADTLYISVVIKGLSKIIKDRHEKTFALNSLMKKYQPEGRYKQIEPNMKILDAVKIIRVDPISMTGKYKIGQNLSNNEKIELAKKILKRNSNTAKETLKIMGITIKDEILKITSNSNW